MLLFTFQKTEEMSLLYFLLFFKYTFHMNYFIIKIILKLINFICLMHIKWSYFSKLIAYCKSTDGYYFILI